MSITPNSQILFNQLETLSQNTFVRIPLNTMKETTITDNILSEIQLAFKESDVIEYDDTYKETGKDDSNIKTRTCADFVLLIKDSNENIHKLSFQAKKGYKHKKIGNVYTELDHKIGNDTEYQIDEYDEFLKKSKMDGYYIFYNGEYGDINNQTDQDNLNGNSFWTLNESTVKDKMGPNHTTFSLTDIIKLSNHTEFLTFLKGVVQ